MASPRPYTRRRSPPNAAAAPPSVTPRSKGGFFCKSILFALFLLALPLFPSQAPEFVGETVLTKFWELIHLLFVGIAVAYGLFSRRSVESSVDTGMRSGVDESSLSYVSRIFQVSSVFDEDACDFRSDESRLVHVSARGSVAVVNERTSESSEYGEVNQVQAWNSQYFQGRSKVVVVARPDYGLDGHVVHQSLGLPVRSLRSGLRDNAALEDSSCDEAVNEKDEETLADKDFDEVVPAPPSPPVVSWDFTPEMMAMGDGYLSNFQPLSVDENNYATLESRSSQSIVSSSSSSRTSFESHTQNRFSPSRSVSEESLNSNVDEPVKEKSLEGSSRSGSPSLPPSPPVIASPPLVNDDDTHKLVLHSRHYSDGSLLEEDVRQGVEDELKGSEVRGRRREIFSKKEQGSKSLKLTAESSRKGKNRSRRSYPPDPISSPVSVADDSTTRRHKSDDHLLEDNTRKGSESDHNKMRVKKGRSQESLELTAKASTLTVPAVDVLVQPQNVKASRRPMPSSRGGRETLHGKDVKRNSEDDFVDLDKSRKKDLRSDNKEVKSSSPMRSSRDSGDTLPVRAIKRNSEDDFMGLDKSRKKDHPGDNKEVKSGSPRRAMRSSREGRDTLPVKEIKRDSKDDFMDLDKSIKKDHPSDNKEVKSSSPRREPQSSRASSKVSSRGKSVRTIRSDHHRKDPKTDGLSSHDRTEAKAESRGRTKSRRQWQGELAIVLHQEKLSETPEPEPEDVTEKTEVEQLQLTLEEEEEAAAAWESQSNASHDHYEVDRKADEFIAKFREQIRLQKLHSGEQPRGGGGGIGIIRNSHFR